MYSVRLTTTAIKELSGLPSTMIARVTAAIDRMEQDPRSGDVKKLKGQPVLWRNRIGDYRILFTIDDKIHQVIVFRILHRKDAYS